MFSPAEAALKIYNTFRAESGSLWLIRWDVLKCLYTFIQWWALILVTLLYVTMYANMQVLFLTTMNWRYILKMVIDNKLALLVLSVYV